MIMDFDPVFKITGKTDVALVRMGNRLDQVNTLHEKWRRKWPANESPVARFKAQIRD